MNVTKVLKIDELPPIEFDSDKVTAWLKEQRSNMLTDRQAWQSRRMKYLKNWDDYITYTRKGLWDESANFHIPLTMQMVKAVHARFKAALFSVKPWWQLIPQEKLDRDRVRSVDALMRWAVKCYINQYKGIESAIDDWIWDFVTEGWGVMKRRWETIERKSIIVEPVQQQAKDDLDIIAEKLEKSKKQKLNEEDVEIVGKEVEKVLKFFDGPVIEPWPHEDILFPGTFSDVSDLNQPFLVCTDFRLTRSNMKYRAESGLYIQKTVEEILEGTGLKPGDQGSNPEKLDIRNKQDQYQGVNTVTATAGVEEFEMSECFFRYDIDEDGIDEELVGTLDLKSNKLVRLTYLDRITKTGQRPLHKIDFIRRPRRAYSLGMLEILYPINSELDAMHNMRVDYGMLTNVPFFFFRSASGLKNEKIQLKPGMGHPLDDPRNDVYFPQMGNATSWGFQEENNLVAWAEKIMSVTAMSMGLPSERVGASRTASGMQSLLNESNVNLDVMLERLKYGYADVLKGVLSDMQERMPKGLKIRVIGADGNFEYGKDNEPLFISPTRVDIGGRVDFQLVANSANSNRELEKQNAILYSQLLMNPINMQMGIVNPVNIYHIMRNILEKHQVIGIEDFITKPEQVIPPLNLYDEIAAVTQGLVPRIVMNDLHRDKIIALTAWAQEPEFLKGIEIGTNHPRAMEALNIAINLHQMFMQNMQAQAQPSNVTGLQISPTLGARSAGMVGETGRSLPQESVNKGQVPQGQQQGGEVAKQ